MPQEPVRNKGGAWFHYGPADAPLLGANVPKPGSDGLTVFWGGRPDARALHEFFAGSADILSTGRAPGDYETLLLLTDDEVHITSLRHSLVPWDLAKRAHFVRFDCSVTVAAPNLTGVAATSPLTTWASLDEPDNSIDSVGVYAVRACLVSLFDRLAGFIEKTSSRPLDVSARNLLGELLDGVAQETV